MAIAYRSTASTAYGTRTNTTVSAPAGAANGADVIVAVIGAGNTSTVSVTTPSGWTLVASVVYSNSDPWAVNLLMYARVHDGASSWTWNHASAGTNGCTVAWQGVDLTTPIDATASTNNFNGGSTSTTGVFSAVTVATSGAQLVGARGSWDGNAITPPSGWSERLDAPVLWVGDTAASGTGSTGAINVPHGNGGGSSVSPWGTIMAALRPAGAATNFSPPFRRNPSRGLIMRGRR